jgi:murein DD-endopeptidase MepM/ murein hydrolase activator NlpD
LKLSTFNLQLLLAVGVLALWMLVLPARGVIGAVVDPAPATPQPTPTPTAESFLQPPFAGRYRVTSYFDHQFPTYEWDDTIVIFDGQQASAIDGILDRAPTFRGGYFLPEAFWYIYYDGHNAFDYGTGAGTTILAAAAGEVVFAGSVPSGCATPLQFVRIRHENGYFTSYLHLEGICVREGEWVETGDPLGISGNSGCSRGPHLHFAVQRDDKYTDPYGWQPVDEPDPLIAYSGDQATWLWGPEQPPLPVGKLTWPPPNAKTNGDLFLRFVPDQDSPPIQRVVFLAFYQGQWHPLGEDQDGEDGWSLAWDTRSVPEGEVWLHAWAVGMDDRVGKGSPIRTDVTVDRHPPQGLIVGLLPGSTAGVPLWLYAASYDPTSSTARVTFMMREGDGGDASPPDEWREIGDATWLHTSNWLLEWDAADIADGTSIDVVARLIDGAGNTTWTQPMEGIAIDRRMPGGDLLQPRSGTPFTTTLHLAFSPFSEGGDPSSISQVAFYVWHNGGWHVAGVDRDGSDGWGVLWDPAYVADQPRVRVQARVYDAQGRVNTALPQVTDLTLDRTPPKAGYTRPAAGGVAHPDVDYWVWARDDGSGVDRVEFFVNAGEGWLKIGEDRYGRDGWSLLWDARGIPDGVVQLKARVYDQAGNVAWSTPVPDVALDRTPPVGRFSFPSPGTHLSGTITMTLDVTDTVSGLDRAVFYARYDERWHHLGADLEHEDGFSLAWDTASFGSQGDVLLTAWVYDRAGNYAALPYVEGLALSATVQPTSVPSPTITPTAAEVPSTSPTPAPTPTAKPLATVRLSPTAPLPATATQFPTPALRREPSPTPLPAPSSTPLPALQSPRSPVPPAFWYLIGGGALIALALLMLSLRNIKAGT